MKKRRGLKLFKPQKKNIMLNKFARQIETMLIECQMTEAVTRSIRDLCPLLKNQAEQESK